MKCNKYENLLKNSLKYMQCLIYKTSPPYSITHTYNDNDNDNDNEITLFRHIFIIYRIYFY